MSDEIIHNPDVPYITHFHSYIKTGTVFVIRGTVLPSAEGFLFSFQCGIPGNADIAFNFNPRFNEGHVLFNTREKNVWSPDENRYKVPFATEQPFDIQVLVTDQEYKVFVDKTFFLDYPHKIPLTRVCAFGVKGDVTLSRVEIQPQMVPFHHHYFPGGQQENTVPFGTKFPSDIKVGTVFIINGTVPPLSDRIFMNFMCGSDKSDDITFHFNPRFDEGKLICNTKRNNAYDTNEERSPLPLKKEDAFEFRFLVEEHAYQVSLNGDHLFDYCHRLSPDTVKTLVIMGCVLLNSVEIQAEASGFHHLYFQDKQIPKTLPLLTPFLVGIREDTVVRIRGTVLPATKSFSIDVQCGDKDKDDIAFNLNIFISKGNISCNTMENEIWGNEELKEEMPFKKGEPFEVRILFASQEYKVSVDRNQLLEYGHRIPVERVNTLAVHGRITVNTVEIQSQGGEFP
ncbi:galectin-9-like [Bufo bufo]|uniref:galectin-9-like n=1 Tax=Bufo bufo TaxID=8384 RepID=UPI001ABE7858|nr:galectin-9-like [Bufo bufo]